MKKNLSYFMKKNREPEIVSVLGPESFVDENGARIMFQIKKLSTADIRKINNGYKDKRVAYGKNGKPFAENGEVLFVVDNDREKALSHIIAEALVYPDLKDEELMKSYDCFDFTDMPSLVFDDINDYNYVAEAVMKVCGMTSAESEDEEIDEAKN